MGTTKANLFTKQQNDLANMAKALANPARIAVLEYLLKVRNTLCGDIVAELGLAQSTISQHLLELKNAGLVQGIADGITVHYCIDPEGWAKYRFVLLGFFVDAPGGND
ncbi:ArsR/SmtB family transcription factor [Taibaiella soli]|uniref:Transcriptional regulator n=1 Tax=Taibaiella soli TaxID=1649169 RepID=A0A2W2ATM0_9BACT|nr:metalloregulator ArsR/SmtB family transcription factor [Taibaiella soli]PZF71294.1 transcriptional regulator [Taibaiella soli]